jgi:hypothetical protein
MVVCVQQTAADVLLKEWDADERYSSCWSSCLDVHKPGPCLS